MKHAEVFTVIADPTRRRIMELLHQGNRSVGELVETLGISQPTVSKQLRILKEAGVATMRAEGQRHYYTLVDEALEELRAWVGSFDAPEAGDPERGARLAALPSAPQRALSFLRGGRAS